jgi:peptidoglycan hydrolase CwlO-like protein
MAYQDFAGDLRNIADHIEGMEENYDNIKVEIQEVEEELDRANDKITQLETYIAWAESYYPDMAGQYKAICDVRG